MFAELPEKDFIEEFWGIYGISGVPRNTGGIQIISSGSAVNEMDTCGFISGKIV
ncbi:hypothetical protein D3C76_1777540 [compost metagenome]